jgi:protein-S-isoprenylcysteine O-methyltransferase Ste14
MTAERLLPLRAAVAAAALPGTGTVIVPWLLLRGGGGGDLTLGPARFAAAATLALGVAGLVWCIVDFARLGRGTLAPTDAPRFVVRGGLYRYVRNPMYVCVVTILLSEAVLFESSALFAWAAIALVAFHLFVLLYEEPTLRRTFGADYEAYRASVPRWIPRPPRR